MTDPTQTPEQDDRVVIRNEADLRQHFESSTKEEVLDELVELMNAGAEMLRDLHGKLAAELEATRVLEEALELIAEGPIEGWTEIAQGALERVKQMREERK